MAEFEELRLKITLIDEASTGIKLLTGTITTLSNTVTKTAGPQLATVGRQINKVSEETKTLSIRLRSVAGGISQATSAVATIGQGVGLIGRMPLALGGLAGIIAGINTALVAFSRSMLDLRGQAMLAGVIPDQFKNMTEQLERFGHSAEEAEADVINFHRTVREANKGGTAEFNRIFSEARDPENVVRFANYLQQLINSGQSEKALALVAERARKIFDREMNRTGGNQAEATRQAESFLGLFGLTLRTLQVREIAPFDNSTKWQERIDLAEKFWIEWKKALEILNDIIAGIQKELLPSFTELNKALRDLGEGWGESIGASIATTLREIKALLAGINWLTGNTPGGGLPGLFGFGGGGGGQSGGGAGSDPRAPYRREGTTAPTLPQPGQQAPGSAQPGPALGVPGFGVPFGSQPPAAPGGDMFSDRFGIWPGGGGKPTGSDVGPGTGAGAGGVPSGGVPLGRQGMAPGGPYTSSRSPRLQNSITTNPAVRDALQIPRQPGESDAAWIARGRRALEGAQRGAGAQGGASAFGAVSGGDGGQSRWSALGSLSIGDRPFYTPPAPPPPTPTPEQQEFDRLSAQFPTESGKAIATPSDMAMLGVVGGPKPPVSAIRTVYGFLKGAEHVAATGVPEQLVINKQLEPDVAGQRILDRSAIDVPMGRQISPQTVEGSGNVNVEITDRGSKVETTGEGMFKGNVETTRERSTGL